MCICIFSQLKAVRLPIQTIIRDPDYKAICKSESESVCLPIQTLITGPDYKTICKSRDFHKAEITQSFVHESSGCIINLLGKTTSFKVR